MMLQTVDEIYKVASVALSPNVPAQIFVSEQISHVVLFYAEADTHLSDKKYLFDLKYHLFYRWALWSTLPNLEIFHMTSLLGKGMSSNSTSE